ncbi:hypothetical protein F4677DRAFT_128991 [Hypoxylon crocopeplum]|nr:hypothetical protein F4677DRAFT_128991 [Hypoxylon crocopeplum]
MASLLSTAVFFTAVQALAFDGKLPRATDGVIPNPTFQLPEITIPPSIHELAKRQNGQTVLVGPDNTCGFVSGRAGAVYSCNGRDHTCALVTASGYGAVACCDGDECGIRVDCVDFTSYYVSSACDNGCVQDTFTVKCTGIDAPYCGTVTFFDGIVDYYCDTLSFSTPQQLYTTYSGESDGRTFTPVVVTLSDGTSAPDSTPDSTPDVDSSSSRPSGTSPVNPTSPSPDSDNDSDNDNDSSNNNNNNNNSGNNSKSTTNVGAIAGGVVGGVAGLALIGLAIFFLVRHNKKKSATAAAANTTLPPTDPMQQAPGAGGPQGPYNPHYSQQYSPQSPPGYPPQQGGYYADQNKPGAFAAVAPAQLPDRNDSTSPMSSQFTDNRQSLQPTSPTSTINSNWQQQQQQAPPNVPPTVHEAGGNVVGERDYNANHHGQLHELG